MSFQETLASPQPPTLEELVESLRALPPSEIIDSGNQRQKIRVGSFRTVAFHPESGQIKNCQKIYGQLEEKILPHSWWSIREAEIRLFADGCQEIVVGTQGLASQRADEICYWANYSSSKSGVLEKGGITAATGRYSPEKERVISPREEAEEIRGQLREAGLVSLEELPERIEVEATARGIFALAVEQLGKRKQGRVDEEFSLPPLVKNR